ncbi:MAG: Crp/Fnr family transcriptional regulator [Clostridia bacterium]
MVKSELDVLNKCRLFKGLSNDEITKIMLCIGLNLKSYAHNEMILNEGEQAIGIGVILKGGVSVYNYDLNGNLNLISDLNKGDMFAESIVVLNMRYSPVTITAKDETDVRYLNIDKIMNPCGDFHLSHRKVINNFIESLAAKNLALRHKLDIIGLRSTKDKILFYLRELSKQQDSSEVVLPFSQTALADYLCVDRSAMCRELTNMKIDGTLKVRGKNIKILKF